MAPQIATCIFVLGIAGLFWLDRDDSVRVSKALWLSVIWLSLNGSRSVSAWLGMGVGMEVPGQPPPVSVLDQAVAASLELLGLIVLVRRRRELKSVLKSSWPVALYFFYCVLSLLWSDFPAWGFKRWARGLGDLIMVLIVATDPQPIAAFKRLFSRVGFVLLPVSILMIKYYVDLSSNWDPWGTERLYTGVTTNKNMLGNLVYVMTLGAIWQIQCLMSEKKSRKRSRRLLAQIILVGFGIKLLFTAHSATSQACFFLGAGLMFARLLPMFRRRPAAIHALVLSIILAGCLIELFGGREMVTGALGREANLSGRTAIWQVVRPMVNGIGGAGFETFWVGPRVLKVRILVGGWGMTNEAHNGYLEAYLNLGWIGLACIALLLVFGYRMSISALRARSELGALSMVYLVTALAYNISEAGFRILSVEWFTVLLSVVMASSTYYRTRSIRPSPSQSALRIRAPLSQDRNIQQWQSRPGASAS